MGTDKSVPFRLPIVDGGLVEDRTATESSGGASLGAADADLSLDDLDAELARLDGEAGKVQTSKKIDIAH